MPNTKTKYLKTRILSFIALLAMSSCCGAVGREAYYVATDSFVAPAILGPNNDMVLEQKVKLSQLLLEKGRAETSLEESTADIEAGEKAVVELENLKQFASQALTWTKTTTGYQVSAEAADLQTLNAQHATIAKMFSRQASLAEEAKKELSAGLIQRQEYTKEAQALDTIQIAMFENDRSRMQTQLMLGQASLGQNALSSKSHMPTPEQVISADQLVRITCQLLETKANLRTKQSERSRYISELEKINELEADLRERPLFKAIDSQLDVAFISYSGLKGVQANSRLMNCTWGLFDCKEVGRVVSIIPGESILPDAFGSGQVRGQFITLTLNHEMHDDSMQSKVLRVRGKSWMAPMRIDSTAIVKK